MNYPFNEYGRFFWIMNNPSCCWVGDIYLNSLCCSYLGVIYLIIFFFGIRQKLLLRSSIYLIYFIMRRRKIYTSFIKETSESLNVCYLEHTHWQTLPLIDWVLGVYGQLSENKFSLILVDKQKYNKFQIGFFLRNYQKCVGLKLIRNIITFVKILTNV